MNLGIKGGCPEIYRISLCSLHSVRCPFAIGISVKEIIFMKN